MGNPYENINGNTRSFLPEKGSLTDIRRASRSFAEINGLIENDVYSFQPEYESRNGSTAVIDGKSFTVFSSYDYLGLIGHDKINEAAKKAIDEFGTGTGGVRLLTGTNSLHRKLERNLAEFKGKEDAITFTSGYAANIAVATAIIGKTGKVYADEKIHRSFIDALTLAGAEYVLFSHNNPEAIRELIRKDESVKRKFIISEGVFSMDGDVCPLPELVKIKNEFGAFLIIDEAHSFGVMGENGRGIDEFFNIHPSEIDIITGSLSKTIPANGGFVLAPSDVVVFMQHECAPFIFSGALCPPAAGASIASLEIIQGEKWRQKELKNRIDEMHRIISKNGLKSIHHSSPVIPILTGDYKLTFELGKYLRENGILVTPVIFPAVPVNESIIRLCASVYHTDEMLNKFDLVLKSFQEL